MEVLFALVTAVLASTGVALMLSRTILRVVLGLTFLAYAANLAILASGGLVPLAPPFLNVEGPYVDPLPQALILTAIVIGFGTTALLLALAVRTYQVTGRDDIEKFGDELNELEALPELRADPNRPTSPEEPGPNEFEQNRPVIGRLREGT